MAKTRVLVEKRDYVEEFKQAYSRARDGILEAAEIYVEAVDEDPANREIFKRELSGTVPTSAWDRLEAIGRKTIDPKLLLGMGGKHTARIKRLPYSLQQAILSGEKFDYLTSSDSTLKIDLLTCTDEQAKQVFDSTELRTISQQKSWIEAEKRERQMSEPVEHYEPYEIRQRKKQIFFKENTVLTFDEVTRLALQCR